MRGDGRVFERGQRWWIAYNINGREVRESAGTTKDDAKNLLRTRHEERLRGILRTPHEAQLRVTDLLDALDEHLTQKGVKALGSAKSHAKPLREFFATVRARNVRANHVNAYVKHRLALGRARATVNRELELLRQSFRLALKEERLSRIPFISMLHVENRRTGFFEKRELDRVASHLPVPVDDIARFGFLTGWRKSEILNSRWEHLDRTTSILRLPTSKNGRPRTLPLTGELSAIIHRQAARRSYTTPEGTRALSAWIFHTNGHPVVDLRKRWTNACTKAKVPGRLFHDLRRSAVRNMIRAGVPQSVAMEITGHTTESIFRRYAITDETQKRDALAKTQALLKHDPTTDPVTSIAGKLGQHSDNPKNSSARGNKKGLATSASPKT